MSARSAIERLIREQIARAGSKQAIADVGNGLVMGGMGVWLRGIVRQCRDAGVACFVKQLGARPVGWAGNGLPPVPGGQLESWPEDLQVRQWPEARDAT